MSIWSKVGLLAGGFLFGTAGVKILASDDDNYDAETQAEDDYISLLEPFPDSDKPFDPK